MSYEPTHHTLVALDIVGYGSRRNLLQVDLVERIRETVKDALGSSGVQAHWEDGGEGHLLIASVDDRIRLVNVFVGELAWRLAEYNQVRTAEAHLRVRVAIDTGDVHRNTPMAGAGTVAVHRLIDAPEFKEIVKAEPHNVSVILSEQVYRSVVEQRYRQADPDEYRQVAVEVKEYQGVGWVRLIGRSASPDDQRPVSPPPVRPGSGAASGVHIRTGDLRDNSGPISFGGNAYGGDVNYGGRS